MRVKKSALLSAFILRFLSLKPVKSVMLRKSCCLLEAIPVKSKESRKLPKSLTMKIPSKLLPVNGIS
jgi:hypothetical protein